MYDESIKVGIYMYTMKTLYAYAEKYLQPINIHKYILLYIIKK